MTTPFLRMIDAMYFILRHVVGAMLSVMVLIAYEALGAQPTPMAYTELYLALQNGTVDTAENSPDVFLQDRFVEVSKTYVMAKIMDMPALIMMSKAKFDGLSPEHRKIMQEAAAEAVAFANAHYKKD